MNSETVVDLLKSPKNEPSAPALTSRRVAAFIHPSTLALALVEVAPVVVSSVAPALAAALRVMVTDALVSRSRKTVACATPPSALTPMSRRGMRCAEITALEAREGLTESLRAGKSRG